MTTVNVYQGWQFHITTTAGKAQSYTISIDGGSAIEVTADATQSGTIYSSEMLSEGTHTVVITATSYVKLATFQVVE